jgi:hypothetical protein
MPYHLLEYKNCQKLNIAVCDLIYHIKNRPVRAHRSVPHTLD